MKYLSHADNPEWVRLQFLPAALEIQHTPPHPLARGTGLALVTFAATALLWACIGTVDVVAIAEGKLIPSSRVKQVQPLEKAVVTAIHVQEGQRVDAGELLVTLDRTSTGAERERIANEWQRAIETLQREQQFLAWLDNGSTPVPDTLPALQQHLLQQQWQQYRAQLAALQSQRDHRMAERQANTENIRKLQATVPIVNRRAASLQQLADRKLVAQDQYLGIEEDRIARQQDLAAALARDNQQAAATAESEQQLAALMAETRAQVLARIADTSRQVASLRLQLTQAEDRDMKQLLHAPVAGQVQDLAIHTVGGVVQEAQQLMLIVPHDARLEVEAMLPNRDIGFVQEGDRAVVKVHTFPFTKYGTLAATVTRISDDALHDQKQAGTPDGLLFGMSLLMDGNTLPVEGRDVRLLPGMQVTVEIITGRRRIIEYFLSPVQRRVQESVRER